jgi:hypothetical protein
VSEPSKDFPAVPEVSPQVETQTEIECPKMPHGGDHAPEPWVVEKAGRSTLTNLHDGLADGGSGITEGDWDRVRSVIAKATGKEAAQ